MKKLRLLIDSDSVIVDMLKDWCFEYNKLYNDTLTTEQFGRSFSDVHKVVKPECGEKVYNIYEREGFFENLTPFDGAITVLEELNKKHDLYVVTSYSGDPNSAKGKVTWYLKNCPFFDVKHNLILGYPKFLLHGDVMIDDSLKNLKAFYNEQRLHRDVTDPFYTVCFSAPHNGNAAYENYVDFVATNWQEVFKIIDELSN